ncbi:MAG: hypothetical protein A2138_17085 [Deltaproteobacteria bacterium RBG_16_71_12]|nr:MAG: hypothetical protein A2138_17085 [Deltaproteobacteria bacterium RBG_16_71_12]
MADDVALPTTSVAWGVVLPSMVVPCPTVMRERSSPVTLACSRSTAMGRSLIGSVVLVWPAFLTSPPPRWLGTSGVFSSTGARMRPWSRLAPRWDFRMGMPAPKSSRDGRCLAGQRRAKARARGQPRSLSAGGLSRLDAGGEPASERP